MWAPERPGLAALTCENCRAPSTVLFAVVQRKYLEVASLSVAMVGQSEAERRTCANIDE